MPQNLLALSGGRPGTRFSLTAASAVALLGLAPHLVFSWQIGEWSWFKSAFDEDIYAHISLNGPFTPHRALSSLLLQALRLLFGGNRDAALIGFDVLLPGACALLAAMAACRLSRRGSVRLLLLTLFLFGQELLSFGSAAIWPVHVETVISRLPPSLRVLVPDYYTSFFAIFRSPEPQVASAVLWSFFLLILSDWQRLGERLGLRRSILIFAVSMCFPFCYVFIGLPLAVLELSLAGILWWLQHRTRAILLAGCFLTSIAVMIAANYLSAAASARLTYLFPSRLPVLTPSVLLSACGAGLLGLLFSRRSGDRRLLLLACPFVLAPLLLMNQQVLTGLMLAPSNWERFLNFPVLMFGLALVSAATSGPFPAPDRRSMTAVPLLLGISCAALVAAGQVRNYGFWYRSNEASVAIARAADDARRKAGDGGVIVLTDPDLAPLVAWRLPGSPAMLLTYADLVRHFIQNMDDRGAIPAARAFHKPHLYEYLARTGSSAGEAESMLRGEALRRSGYFLGFLFGFRDFWYPASCDRLVRQEWILEQLPAIVGDYASQLDKPPASWLSPAMVVSRNVLPERARNGLWRNVLLSEASARGSRAFAYLQVPLKLPGRAGAGNAETR